MAVSDPYPGIPVDGGQGDAVPILAKFNALFQAVQNFDGSQIASKSVVEAALADAVNPRLRGSDTLSNFVHIGCIWSLVSGLNGTMTGGTIYVNGYRQIVAGVGSQTFNASNDTYVDIDYLGNVYYLPVSNGGTAPGLTANALRVAKIVTSGSAITSVVQSGYDGNFVQIYNQNPPQLSLVNTVQSVANSGSAGGNINYINLGGIKFAWGNSAVITMTSQTSQSLTVTFPTGFFTTIQASIATPTGGPDGTTLIWGTSTNSITTSTWQIYAFVTSNVAASGTLYISWFVIGT